MEREEAAPTFYCPECSVAAGDRPAAYRSEMRKANGKRFWRCAGCGQALFMSRDEYWQWIMKGRAVMGGTR
ncbi:MAG: hypothetical protein GEU73_11120 [Chloroflexi bacterium]|nr:hypothetical protein [Chloroflexota bacterium]